MTKQDMPSTTMSRRRFLQYSVATGAALSLPWVTQVQVASAAVGPALPKFVQPLPMPGSGLVVATPSGANAYSFTQKQISKQLHPNLPATPLFAYDDGTGLAGQAGSFGMVVAAEKGTPLTINYTNSLPERYPAWIPVDTRLRPDNSNAVRVLTHLHGGFVAGSDDGNPAATPGEYATGATQTAHYLNNQPATLLWFHDHGFGTTRLNVFAGLAAGYILRDEFDTGRADNANRLPYGAYEIPLVIQDRQFNTNGTMLYPVSAIPGVTWIGEYFGDTMLVNGKIWPFLNVEPRMYRFRILNGCNARILNLSAGGLQGWLIGNEGGMFDRPVLVKQLVLAPAERADLLFDFSPLAGQTFVIRNTRPPAPVSNPAPALAAVMQIRVGTTVSQPGLTTVPASLIGGKAADLGGAVPVQKRYITLNEVAPGTAGWFLNLNGRHFDEGQQTPTAGDVEDWVYINLTADTHPMHPHLVHFQVIGRTPFNVAAYQAAFGGTNPQNVPGGNDPTPFAIGPMLPADPDERGFKDTVKANPGYFTTIRAKFDLPPDVTGPQTYVHHCHIVEHEDNDMMEKFTVQ